jgi:RimJ/RimL family protein N-acetyltransferase
MKNAFLIGERVYLRPLEREDAGVLQAYINDPEVTAFLCVHQPLNRQREEEFIDRVAKVEHDLALGVALKSDDRLIGTVGLHGLGHKDRKAELGISIGAKEEWGKGYGGEAIRILLRHGFETLNLNRIQLRVFEFNARARRCYEKAGFRPEGVLRQDLFRRGRYWDTHLMAVLREEWEAQVARRSKR